MYKIVFNILCLLIGYCGYSQPQYEQGYYLDKEGNQINGFIKNMDWRNNPSQIKFRSRISEPTQEIELASMNGFKIEGSSEYYKFNVQIDRSSNNIKSLSEEKDPINVEETLLLRLILDGDIKVFMYTEPGLVRFFYLENGSKIPEQLVYKQYKYYEEGYQLTSENLLYQNQLRDLLSCHAIHEYTFKLLKYKQEDMIKIFSKYFDCINSYYELAIQEKNELKFSVALRQGFRFFPFEMNNDINAIGEAKFDNNLSYSTSVVLEYFIPFYGYRWSMVIEPTYQYYNKETTVPYPSLGNPDDKMPVYIRYSSIEVPIGCRFYAFGNETLKSYLGAQFTFDIVNKDSRIYAERRDLMDIDIKSEPNGSLSTGLILKNRLGMEIRYNFSRELFRHYALWTSNYSGTSIMISFIF